MARPFRAALHIALLTLLWAAPAQASESFARHVPASAGLFVELQNAGDLLLPLTETQTWLTVAELAGQPARPEEADLWRVRVRQSVRMDPIDAIRRLFSERVAFVAAGPRRTQDGVVLCQPIEPPRTLIEQWHALPLPTAGKTQVYRLPNNVGLAVVGEALLFGDAAGRGMFPQVLELADNNRSGSLADDPTYRKLLAQIPPNPCGILFARLSDQPPESQPTQSQPSTTAAPSDQLPALLRGSSSVLLALHRDGSKLRFTVVGDAPGVPPQRTGSLPELVGALPLRTLFTWAGHVPYGALTPIINRLPENHALRIVFRMQERAGTVDHLVGALGTATCVAVGTVDPLRRQISAPPVPTVALLVQTRDPTTAEAEWRTLVKTTVAIYKLLSLKLEGTPRRLEMQEIEIAGANVTQIDLSPLLPIPPELSPLGEVHLSWTLHDGVLIIASHTDWLRQILAARRGAAPKLAQVLDASALGEQAQRENIFVAQTGPTADLGQMWEQFFQRFAPQILRERWWRSYQPGGRRVRLGAQVSENAEHHRLAVTSITPRMPADGILQVGDEIIGCNRHRFSTDNPLREIQLGIERRPNARWVDLLVERDRTVRVRRVPLPFVDPVQILRRVVSVGRLVQRVVYHDDAPGKSGSRGHLTVELRAGEPALFNFALTPNPNAQPIGDSSPPHAAPGVESRPALR